MKNQNLFLMLTLVLIGMFFVNFASATATVNITTVNGTEFNTATPSISVNVTGGNCSAYYVNITAGGTLAVSDQAILNATETSFTLSALTTGANYTYNATVWNETCDSGQSDDSDHWLMEVNARPTVTTVTESTAGNLLVGNTMTWTTVWADSNSTGTDGVKVYVCKTDAFTTSCTGGEWASSSTEYDLSTAPTYTILTSDTAGLKNYYVYLLDDNNYASSSSTSGTFTISKPVEDEGEDGTYFAVTEEEEPSGLPFGLIVVIGIVVIVGLVVFSKKK